jgi:predicted Fe-Mo cluster-binding NifX family protein
MHFEAMANTEDAALPGIGFQVAELVVEHGVQAVVTGNVGPNAFSVFRASGVPVYLDRGRTVREAVAACKDGQLQPLEAASVSTHSGARRAAMQDERNGLGAIPPVPSAPFATREEEMAALEEMAKALRDRLAQVVERLDHLGNEG